VLLFILLVWIPVEAAFHAWCFNNFDLGIYAQAIHEISLSNPNPWLSVRNINLFRDHFEPVFFLLLPFKALMSPALLAIRMDMLAILTASLAPMWLGLRKLVSPEVALVSATIVLLSPLTLDAAYFSAHPGTWSLAPLAWMLAFLFAGMDKAAFLMFFLTLICKEEYPVVGFMLGVAMILKGRKRTGLAFSILSVIWAVGVFLVRPVLLGPSDFHTNTVSNVEGAQFFHHLDGLKILLQRNLELLVPIGVLLYGRGPAPGLKRMAVPMAVLLTVLAIRYAGGYWGNHRVAPLGVASAFFVIYWLCNMSIPARTLKVFAVSILALSFADLELGSRYWLGKPFKKHCVPSEGRLASLAKAADYLKANVDGAVLAGGNLIPPMVDLPGIGHLGDTQATEFKYLFVEKGPQRNPWPISPEEFSKVEQSWRGNPKSRVIQDDEYVLLMER
jgi:hypothetical protein